ncbi:MAG: hypothetical protein V1678_04935 [Candidatus Aenigmatarchaeota archaeon]
MNKIALIIFAVLLVCGCVLPDLGNTTKKVKELPADVIVVQNVNTLPRPPINAGDEFSVSFEVASQEEQRYVNYVGYNLLDSGLCRPSSKSRNALSGVLAQSSQPFLPKQTEFVEWTFETPDSMYLAYINSKCPVRFKVNYSFDAISQTEVDIISDEKYDQMQQSNQFVPYVPTLSIGRGPLKISMEFGATQPLKSDSSLPLYITVEDRGAGFYSEIPKDALVIKMPPGFDLKDGSCGERFDCVASTNECKNNIGIMMIEKKSPTFRCSFITPSVKVEKVYSVEANINYTYEIINQAVVQIKTPSGV